MDIHLDFDTYIACTGINKIVYLIERFDPGNNYITMRANSNAIKTEDDIKMAEYIL